jgi:glycosyltransferase involved in cell wall biosynthesis
VVVAPLRLARGVQNKILEAMAMGRPVVASQACADALGVATGGSLLGAADAEAFVRQIDSLLQEPPRAAAIGSAGRQCVASDYGWAARLSAFERHIAAPTARVPEPVPA